MSDLPPLPTPTSLHPPAVPAPTPPAPAAVPTPVPTPTPAAPAIPPPRFTSFSTIGYLNAKHVASAFVKQDSQSFHTRRKTDADWDRDEAAKRRRLLGEEGAPEGVTKVDEDDGGGKASLTGGSGNVLVSGEAKPAKAGAGDGKVDETEGEVS